MLKYLQTRKTEQTTFRSTSASKQLLTRMQVTPCQTHFIFCPKEPASWVGDRRAFPPASQAGQAAGTSSQSDISTFHFSTTTTGRKKLIQLLTFIFRSSSVKIVGEKSSGVRHFLSQITMKMEFAFLCLEDLHRVKSQAMQVIHEQ